MVVVTTALLRLLNGVVESYEGDYARPFGIGYLLPIAAMTWLGGYRVGVFTVFLSLLLARHAASNAGTGWEQYAVRNAAEVGFIALTGAMTVAIVEQMQRNGALLAAVRDSAEHQRRFVKDVLSSVRDRKLTLCQDESELPPSLPAVLGPFLLTSDDIRSLRKSAEDISDALHFAPVRCQDLITAVGEIAMNAIVHGGGGEGYVSYREDGTIQVRVEDRGTGIAPENLPHATLERGFTATGTLGHGFWMVLNTVDRVWLLTGPTGTTVVIEKDRNSDDTFWGRRK